jgi:hypothetical protein
MWKVSGNKKTKNHTRVILVQVYIQCHLSYVPLAHAQRVYTLAAHELEELFSSCGFVSENNTMIDVTSLLHYGAVT